MRSLTTTFIWILSLNMIYSQVPLGFSFQTIIRDSEGKVQKNQATGIQFSILEGSATGTVVYSETHTITTNEYGVINLTVGTGTVTEGVFSDIVWGSIIHFLKTEIDPAGGNIYTISTTSQLMSVPYAMYAMKADTAIKTNIPSTANNGDILYYKDGNWNQLTTDNQGDFLRVNEVGEPNWQSFVGYVSDVDGNQYETVKIGTQVWFAQNLNTSRYNDGSLIPNIKVGSEWSNDTLGSRAYYNNDSTNYSDIYGALYNWYAVNTGNLCPTGFHVPTDEEWDVLENYLGGRDIAGGKLKEIGTTHWLTTSSGATNESGFTALPGGSRDFNSSFNYINSVGLWWSSSASSSDNVAWNRDIYDNLDLLNSGSNFKKNGFSIRCLKSS